ncbi:MAG: YdcF family protein, partial [Polyangiaceae bacterium]
MPHTPPTDDAEAALAPRALVVLGCRVSPGAGGRLEGALGRRVEAAAAEYARRGEGAGVVVASGGRRWAGVVEADAMARELARRGVPPGVIVRERCSLSTRDNARFAVAALERRGIARATVVTCAWHLPRAVALFRRAGMVVDGLPAPPGDAPWRKRFWRWGRETVLTLLVAAVLVGCSKAAPTATLPAEGAAPPAVDLGVVARA